MSTTPSIDSHGRPLIGRVTACDSAAYLGGYCAAKLPRLIKPLTWRVPKHLLQQSFGGVLIRDGHASFSIRSDATVMAILI